jgi:hypothetical protein
MVKMEGCGDIGSGSSTLQAAVASHHPSEAVLFEAAALDRELGASMRSFDALERGIRSFVVGYPSVLLHSPSAILSLGQACLDGNEKAKSQTQRTRFAELLLEMFAGILDEVLRENAQRVEAKVPKILLDLATKWMERQAEQPSSGLLAVPLLVVGRKVIMTAEDGLSPDLWFQLLRVLTSSLIQAIRLEVSKEPIYDGRFDDTSLHLALETFRLESLRPEGVASDLHWLGGLESRLCEGQHGVVDAFLEVSTYRRREERRIAWEQWLQTVAERSQDQAFPGEALAGFLKILGEWIEGSMDRRFLLTLAGVLRRTMTSWMLIAREEKLQLLVKFLVRAIQRRLEKESGRGEPEPSLELLRTIATWIVERKLGSSRLASDIGWFVETGRKLRTGPVEGWPVSREDAIWRMTAAVRVPESAEGFLSSLFTGLGLENVLFRDGFQNRNESSVGEAMVGLLRHPWKGNTLRLVRAVVRVMPLSPFHLGNTTTRSHLMALHPEERSQSYLYDLKERVLSHGVGEGIAAVEKVLQFWKTGLVDALDDLASPESLVSLPALKKQHRIDVLAQLIQRLGWHVPGMGKEGIRWMAEMPEAFYDEETIMKVAGFSGCARSDVGRLVHLLHVYRALVEQSKRRDSQSNCSGCSVATLLEKSAFLLQRRRETLKGLFHEQEDGSSLIETLECFDADLDLVREEDAVLRDLARLLTRDGQTDVASVRQAVGMMLENLLLSGLESESMTGVWQDVKRIDENGSLGKDLFRRMVTESEVVRSRWLERLHPHVVDSVERLLTNPLSTPSAACREVFDSFEKEEETRRNKALLLWLVEDLLSADGNLFLLAQFARQLSEAR